MVWLDFDPVWLYIIVNSKTPLILVLVALWRFCNCVHSFLPDGSWQFGKIDWTIWPTIYVRATNTIKVWRKWRPKYRQTYIIRLFSALIHYFQPVVSNVLFPTYKKVSTYGRLSKYLTCQNNMHIKLLQLPISARIREDAGGQSPLSFFL